MATHSSTLAWKIPWMKEPGMLQSMGSQSRTQNVPLVSLIFLKRSLVFPILLFSSIFFILITEEGFLISPCYSLELYIPMDMFPFLLAFCFSSFHSCL